MAAARSLRRELDELRHEFESWRMADSALQPVAEAGDAESQFAGLNRMVHDLFDEAEKGLSQHPVATVAGALALGIVIGRLTTK